MAKTVFAISSESRPGPTRLDIPATGKCILISLCLNKVAKSHLDEDTTMTDQIVTRTNLTCPECNHVVELEIPLDY